MRFLEKRTEATFSLPPWSPEREALIRKRVDEGLSDNIDVAECLREIERLRALLDSIAAVTVGGAGTRRICDGPGAYSPESGPTYDEIYNAHREIESLTDER